MRLEIDSYEIKDLKEGPKTCVENGVLYVNKKELEELILQDANIEKVDIQLVYPGDKTRILNVQDVIQPRAKVEGQDFPGWLGKVKIAGSGKTLSLDGTYVINSNASTNRIESGLLDMDGPMRKLSPYANTPNVVVASYAVAGTEERAFEDSVKCAGFKAAAYLANAAKGLAPDKTEVFDMDMYKNKKEGLPRIGYIFQCYSPQFDYLAVSDKIFYGRALTGTLPLVIHPNEILDGGVMGWNALKAIDSVSYQNNAIIKELYKHDGVDLNFGGVILVSANTDADNRDRNCQIVADLAKNVLNLDGVIISKILGGMPHIDISSMGVACENAGVKTCVHTTPLTAVGTLGDTILFNDECLTAIVTSSSPFERTVINFKAEKFIGGTAETKLYSSEMKLQLAGDERINIEQYLTAGVHDHTGGRKVQTLEY